MIKLINLLLPNIIIPNFIRHSVYTFEKLPWDEISKALIRFVCYLEWRYKQWIGWYLFLIFAAADSSYYTLIHPNSKLIRRTFQNDKSENKTLFLHTNLGVSRSYFYAYTMFIRWCSIPFLILFMIRFKFIRHTIYRLNKISWMKYRYTIKR